MDGSWSDFPKNESASLLSRLITKSSGDTHGPKRRTSAPASSRPPHPPPSPPPGSPSTPSGISTQSVHLDNASLGPTVISTEAPVPLANINPTAADAPTMTSTLPSPAATAASTETTPDLALSQSKAEGTENEQTDSFVQTLLNIVSPEKDDATELSTTASQTQEPLPSTEPIVTQPYSTHSLKIIELPPSSIKLATELVDLTGKDTESTNTSIQLADDKPALISSPGTPKISEGSPTQNSDLRAIALSQFDLSEFADADLSSAQYLWPTENNRSIGGESNKAEEDMAEIERSKSAISQSSLQDNRRRGPRDVDEAMHSSMTLIDKMENRAKRLFSRKKKEDADNTTDNSVDTLLIEEDEAATSALLHKIQRRASHVEALEKRRASIVTPSVGSTNTNQEHALVPYNPKIVESDKTFESTKEEPTSTARLKRSVRYQDDEVDITNRLETAETDSLLRNIQSIDTERNLQIIEPSNASNILRSSLKGATKVNATNEDDINEDNATKEGEATKDDNANKADDTIIIDNASKEEKKN